MPRRILTALLAAAALWMATAEAAFAHPHVFVTMVSEIVYGPDGGAVGVRHAWTFDDMFSTFATQGLESKVPGQFTKEELAPLAEVNVTSLKEYDYFTYAKADGHKAEFKEPVDYWLDYTNQILTLHYFLPFKTPVKAKALNLEVYDPTYFVDFTFREKDPVSLAGAPASCKASVASEGNNTSQGQKLSEAFFNDLSATSTWGQQFAKKISIAC